HAADAPGDDLRGATKARLDELSEAELRLLEVLASAPSPIDRGLLFAVAGGGAAPQPALPSLAGGRLRRRTGGTARPRRALHDQALRQAIAKRTPPERWRDVHLETARMLSARPDADPLEVAGCYARGGAPSLACHHVDYAAALALGEGSTERAAYLWERAA